MGRGKLDLKLYYKFHTQIFAESLKNITAKMWHLQISCLITSRQQHTRKQKQTQRIMKQAEYKTQNN